MSLFSNVEPAPPIEVFKLSRDFQSDTHPQKVSLGVGAYRTEEGKPWILPVVKKATHKLAEDIEAEKINHEYLPVLGLESFSTNATKMLLVWVLPFYSNLCSKIFNFKIFLGFWIDCFQRRPSIWRPKFKWNWSLAQWRRFPCQTTWTKNMLRFRSDLGKPQYGLQILRVCGSSQIQVINHT